MNRLTQKTAGKARWRAMAPIVLATLLASSRADAALPRVMLVIDEKNLGSIPTSEIETLAVRLLLERQFPSVDQDMVRATLAKQQHLLKSVGDSRGAAALGQQFGAEVIIVGEAVAKPSARRIADSNLRTYQAVVTLRAVRTDNSENIASASGEATALDIEDVRGGAKALRKAGQTALEDLLDQVSKRFAAEAAETRILVTFGGVDAAWKLKALRDQLRSMREIADCRQRSYGAGAAVFEIDARTPAETLAERIVTTAPPGLGIQMLEVTPGAMQFRVVERGSSP